MRGDVLAGDRPSLPYPSGWFCVGFSRELPAGRVITRRLAGEDVVVYRTRGGTIRAVRPYCPHLGAHLGVGGTVQGELLVCPFHRFAFDSEGACAKAPSGKPPRARVEHYAVREQHGIVFAWHGQGEPTWELPEIGHTGFGPTVFSSMDLASHPQEIQENGFDFRHFRELHHMDVRRASPLEADGPYLRIDLRLRVATLPLIGDIVVDQPSRMAGLGLGLTDVAMPDHGLTVRTWVLPTPLDPWRTRLHLAAACEIRAPKLLPAPLRRAITGSGARAVAYGLLRRIVKIVDDDVPIWDYKKYEPRPRLTSDEKGIGPYRRWARQFYPLPPATPAAP
jgi:phenylpropionate dioxygenase-like ring-hydroxylating dioxygenase large terminal subunit